jgi:hypothetical protein
MLKFKSMLCSILNYCCVFAYFLNRCLGVIIQLSEQEQEELYEIGVTIGKIVSLKHYQLLNSKN